jgi:RsiW-degrading membrane proteinase PrsW (M82 family)
MKHTLSIIGIAIQCFGIGFMFYGRNNNRNLFLDWVCSNIFFGLAIVFVGILSNKTKNK